MGASALFLFSESVLLSIFLLASDCFPLFLVSSSAAIVPPSGIAFLDVSLPKEALFDSGLGWHPNIAKPKMQPTNMKRLTHFRHKGFAGAIMEEVIDSILFFNLVEFALCSFHER